MRVEFKERGQGKVAQLGKILTQSVKNVDIIGKGLVRSNAEIYHKALISNIEGQKLSFAALTPRYSARKGILGLDSRVLFATGEYVGSINIKPKPKSGGRFNMHVGVDEGSSHSGGINMGLLAKVMEYGTADGRIPARPHYGPTWKQVQGEVKSNTLKFARRIWQTGR